MTPSAPGETNDGRESFQPLTALQHLLVRSRDEAEEEMFPAAPPSLRAAKKNPYKFHWRRARLSFLFIIFTISLLNFLVLAGPMFRFEAIKKADPNGCFEVMPITLFVIFISFIWLMMWVVDSFFVPTLAPEVARSASPTDLRRRKIGAACAQAMVRFYCMSVMSWAVWPHFSFAHGLLFHHAKQGLSDATCDVSYDGQIGARGWFAAKFSMVAVMVWEMSYMKLRWEMVVHHNALIAYVLYTTEGNYLERRESSQAKLNGIAAFIIFGAALGGLANNMSLFFYHLAGAERVRVQLRVMRVAVICHTLNLCSCYSTIPVALLALWAHDLSTFDVCFYCFGILGVIAIEAYLREVYHSIFRKKRRQVQQQRVEEAYVQPRDTTSIELMEAHQAEQGFDFVSPLAAANKEEEGKKPGAGAVE